MVDRGGIGTDHKFVAGRTLAALLTGALLATGCGGSDQRSVSTNPTQSSEVASPAQIEQALQNLAARAAEQPTEPYWPTQMAAWSLQAQDEATAENQLRAALALDPDYGPALSQLARMQYEAGRHDEAIALLEASRGRQGELPAPLRVGLALHYQAVQRFDEAEDLLASLDGGESDGVRGYSMLTGDDYLQAFETTQRAVQEHPDVAAHHNNHGISLLYRGEPELAREEFLTALQLQPGLAGAMYNLAIVEKFYFFDEEASRRWFDQYAQRADADPDGLRELLAAEASTSQEAK